MLAPGIPKSKALTRKMSRPKHPDRLRTGQPGRDPALDHGAEESAQDVLWPPQIFRAGGVHCPLRGALLVAQPDPPCSWASDQQRLANPSPSMLFPRLMQ